MWTHDNFAVNGDIVVGIPTRDILIVTGAEKAENLERAKKIVMEAYSEGVYTLTPQVFVCAATPGCQSNR